MEWFRTHLYITSAIGALLLFVIGGFIVSERSAIPPAAGPAAWSGANAPVLALPSASPQTQTHPNELSIMQQVQSAPPYNYIPIVGPNTASDTSSMGGSFDYDSFISMLSNENSTKSGPISSNTSASDAYSFIPGGFLSTTTSNIKRTPLQQQIYDYGNEAGSYIQSFENRHPNEAQVLKDQAEDRTNADKAAALQNLGKALAGVGVSLLKIEDVPTQMQTAHAALAQSYEDIGAKLSAIATAKNDQDFIAAINTYNASVDTFTKKYVSLANLFVSYGVKFSQDDSGSVFTFTPINM